MLSRFRVFRKREEGAASLEFVILFPAFAIILMSSIEAGMLMIRNVLLDHAVDVSVRSLRLGINPPGDEDELRKMICAQAKYLPDCENAVRVELVRVATDTWSMPSGRVTCVQRGEELQPVLQFQSGVEHEVMLLRACAVFDPFFPTTGLGLRLPKDSTGAYSLVSSSAFVVEPA